MQYLFVWALQIDCEQNEYQSLKQFVLFKKFSISSIKLTNSSTSCKESVYNFAFVYHKQENMIIYITNKIIAANKQHFANIFSVKHS